MSEIIRYAWGMSSLGGFLAAASERGLVAVEFGEPGTAAVAALRRRVPDARIIEDPALMRPVAERVAALIEHPDWRPGLAIDARGNEFERRVWTALVAIPAGETMSYGALAARIGAPRQAKEVAEACAANALAVIVPCHRVVRKDGSIAGYRWGVRRKRALLDREREASRRLAG